MKRTVEDYQQIKRKKIYEIKKSDKSIVRHKIEKKNNLNEIEKIKDNFVNRSQIDSEIKQYSQNEINDIPFDLKNDNRNEIVNIIPNSQSSQNENESLIVHIRTKPKQIQRNKITIPNVNTNLNGKIQLPVLNPIPSLINKKKNRLNISNIIRNIIRNI